MPTSPWKFDLRRRLLTAITRTRLRNTTCTCPPTIGACSTRRTHAEPVTRAPSRAREEKTVACSGSRGQPQVDPPRVRPEAPTPAGPVTKPPSRPARLFSPDIGRPDDLAPFLRLFRHQLAEIVGRSDHRPTTQIGEPRLDLRIGQGGVDPLVQPADDLRRRVSGRAEPAPRARLVTRHK